MIKVLMILEFHLAMQNKLLSSTRNTMDMVRPFKLKNVNCKVAEGYLI